MMRFRDTEVGLPAGEVWLGGRLLHAPGSRGLVLVTERGNGRMSDTRNAYIASVLNSHGLATLQFALLSRSEEHKSPDTWHNVSILATRILAVIEWVKHQPSLEKLPLGLLAQDEAAGAMVRVANKPGSPLKALVSRSGRPDLAGIQPLKDLNLPLLLLTGSADFDITAVNDHVGALLEAPHETAVLSDASHNFEEPGALDRAAQMIAEWFVRWLK
jgi:putative phosphoribosyl transferase